jgi:hypothetical protein
VARFRAEEVGEAADEPSQVDHLRAGAGELGRQRTAVCQDMGTARAVSRRALARPANSRTTSPIWAAGREARR